MKIGRGGGTYSFLLYCHFYNAVNENLVFILGRLWSMLLGVFK